MPAPDRFAGSTALEQYLERLEAALVGLSADERREILLETRSHVAERMQRDASLSVEDVLGDLGEPERYAEGFLPKSQAHSNDGTLAGIATLATSGWRSFPVLALVVAGYGFISLLVFVAIAKILEPGATGWYVGSAGGGRSIGLVLSDPRHGGRDVLGYWLVPITLSIAFVIHWLLSRLLRRFARSSSSQR